MDGMGKAMPKGDGLVVPFNGSINFGQPELRRKDATIEETVLQIEKAVLSLAPVSKEIIKE